MASVTAGGEIGIRAASFGMQSQVLDGNDLWAVREAALEAVGRARARRRADAARVPDLPPLRPLEVRPGEVPPAGGGGALARARPARPRARAAARPRAERGASSPRRRPRSTRRWSARSRTRSRRRTRTRRRTPARSSRDERAARVPQGDPRRARRGDRARPVASSSSARTSRSPGGVFMTTPGLHEKHGHDRVFDTPISELAMAGAAFGAAVTGLRPVIEIMFGDFMALPMDSLVNQAAKYWYVSNEQASVPLVVRSAVGAGGRFGAMHSQIHGTWFQGIPGIKVVGAVEPGRREGPAEVGDPRRQPRDLPRAQAPVLGEGPAAERGDACRSARRRWSARAPTSRSSRRCRGVRDALEAAEELADDGIDAEVVDLRSLRPLDHETVLESVAKTNRVMLVEEGPRVGRLGGQPARHRRGRGACTSSTTPGSSPPATRPLRTAPRSRTLGCRRAPRSRPPCASASAWRRRPSYASPRPRPRSRSP